MVIVVYRWKSTPDIARDLSETEELRTSLDSGVLPRRWDGRLRREFAAAATAASVTMEGVRVTVEQVIEIMAGTRPERLPAVDLELTRGYHEAMRYVLNRADDPNFAWNGELIRTVHYHVMGGSLARGAGRLRDREVQVVEADTLSARYTPPPAELVASLLDDLATWLNAHPDLPAPVLAAVVHVRIAGIHPFVDGNGRTARVAAALAMYRAGYTRPELTSLEEWWGRHHAEYYAAFGCLGSQWKTAADVTDFVAAHVRAQRLQAQDLARHQVALGQVWRALEDVVRDEYDRPVRLASALYDALVGREVRASVHAATELVSLATANADLKALADLGLLQRTGAGRSVRYIGTPVIGVLVARELGLTAPDSGHSVEQGYEQLVGQLKGERR